MLAALAGLVVSARLNSATPKAGVGFELDVIAAVTLFDYQQLRYADQPWLPQTPRLQALAEAWNARPSLARTRPFLPPA
mgnify:CR=1 FL=1